MNITKTDLESKFGPGTRQLHGITTVNHDEVHIQTGEGADLIVKKSLFAEKPAKKKASPKKKKPEEKAED